MSKTQTPQAVNDYLSEITRDRSQFMGHFEQITNRAKEAGVTQDELRESISRNYGAGSGSSGGSSSSSGSTTSNRE